MPTSIRAGAYTRTLRRVLLVAAAVLAGLLASAGLLAVLGGSVRPAFAAPNAPTVRPWPGSAPCNTSLQACLDGSSPGDTIEIQPNTYVTSVTLSQAVSLTGVSSATVILQALAGQRVLTVTGASINASVVISGITFRGGNVAGASCPAGCGGGILITGTASPLLRSLTITNNVAQYQGGGLFAGSGSLLQLQAVHVLSNTSGNHGSGVRTSGPVTLTGGLFYNNRCTGAGCGAAALYAGGDLSVNGTRFISNTSVDAAAAVYTPFAATFVGGLFQDNRCTDSACLGGALYVNANLVLSGTQFLSNTSHFGAGALFVNLAASLTNAVFRNNQCTAAGCAGGALRATALTVTNTQFISNSSVGGGGAVSVYDDVSALNSLVQDNRCTAAGCVAGGLYAGLALTLTNTSVLSNTSVGDGGGAYANGRVVLSGGVLQNNRCTGASCRPGGLYAGSGLLLTNTQVISNASLGDGSGIRVQGPVTVTSGLFLRNSCSQAGCGAGGMYAGGVASFSNTTFMSNTALIGAGGLYTPLPATIVGGLFQGNSCLEDLCTGGGLYTNNSLLLTGTQFLSNTARAQGGALFANQTVTLTGALLRGNQCTAAACVGGAILALDGLTLRASQVTSNTAVGSGGGWLVHTTAVISDSQMLGNSAGESGGGGYASGYATLSGSVFQENRCTDNPCNGGGLYADGPATVTGTLFLTNTSLFDGGGLYANATLTLTNSVFQGNACTQTFCYAGGVLANGPALLAGASFVDNTSQSHGGGIFAVAGLTVTRSVFRGNRSGEGGAVLLQGATGLIVNSLFAGNTATSGHGAALSLVSTGTVDLVHNTLVSATLGSGSAVYVLQRSARLTNTLVSGYAIGLERGSGSLVEDYTLFAGVGAPYSGTISAGLHSLTGTAAFVDGAAGDFHLSAASDAIDAGVPAGVPLDFDGQTRPVGAAPDIGFDEWYARLYLPQVLR